MKPIVTLVLCAGVALSSFAKAQDTDQVDQAKRAAQQWLALADAGQYAASWTEAAAPLQKAVSQTDWEHALQSLRGAGGAQTTRELSSATFSKTLPGAPEGAYVVLQYSSKFGADKDAVETVVPMLEQDGRWRVSGYFIK